MMKPTTTPIVTDLRRKALPTAADLELRRETETVLDAIRAIIAAGSSMNDATTNTPEDTMTPTDP